jgi:hypothetical protein
VARKSLSYQNFYQDQRKTPDVGAVAVWDNVINPSL